MDGSRTPAELRRLIGLRYAVVVLVAVSVLCMRFLFDASVRWAPVTGSLVALMVVNGALHWYTKRRGNIAERALFTNFVLELAALTALLYFVGGSTSPLVSLYLLPVTMAANLLTRRHTWVLGRAHCALLFACCSR